VDAFSNIYCIFTREMGEEIPPIGFGIFLFELGPENTNCFFEKRISYSIL